MIAGVAAALLLASLVFGGGEDSEVAPDSPTDPAEELVLVPSPETVAGSANPTPATGSGTVTVDVNAGSPSTAAADPAPAQPEPEPAASTPTVHTVASGDTLGAIATKYYGSSADWPKIQAANKELLGDGVALQIGMKLKIPAR